MKAVTHTKMEYHEKIQLARTFLDESQTDFGKRFGVSQNSVGKWESGKSEAGYRVLEFVEAIMEEIKRKI